MVYQSTVKSFLMETEKLSFAVADTGRIRKIGKCASAKMK